MGSIEVSPIADLEQVRGIINKLFNNNNNNNNDSRLLSAGDENSAATTAEDRTDTNGSPCGDDDGGGSGGGNTGDLLTAIAISKLSSEWCFVDSCTAERFFRVDRAQEHLHYLTDIANETLYILDQDSPTMPPTPEDEHGHANSILHQSSNLSASESR